MHLGEPIHPGVGKRGLADGLIWMNWNPKHGEPTSGIFTASFSVSNLSKI